MNCTIYLHLIHTLKDQIPRASLQCNGPGGGILQGCNLSRGLPVYTTFGTWCPVLWGCKHRRRILNPSMCSETWNLMPKLLKSTPIATVDSIGFDIPVHRVISIPSKDSIASVIGKGKSQPALPLPQRFPWLSKAYWSDHCGIRASRIQGSFVRSGDSFKDHSFSQGYLFFSLDLFICIRYENNIPSLPSLNQRCISWPENLISVMIWPKPQKILCELPTMHMSSEKHKPSFCQHSLASIWSLQGWPSAGPRPASAAFKLNSAPIVSGLPGPKKTEAADIVKTCRCSRKPNCSNLSSKKSGKAKSWWSRKSTRLMKQNSAKKSRLPPSIACWPATGGSLPAQTKRLRIECNNHKPPAPILCFRIFGAAPSIRLGYAVPESSRCCACRSYPCPSGGHC